jgi:hypothetical protein
MKSEKVEFWMAIVFGALWLFWVGLLATGAVFGIMALHKYITGG